MKLRISLVALLVAVVAGAILARPAPAWTGPITVPSDRDGDTLAVFYSGDGGWGPLDQKVADRLADHGVPTVGINSLAYFHTAREPEAIAQDLASEVRTYEQRWGRRKVVLIGYSFGADALPAIIPRLPADVRGQATRLVLIGAGPYGDLRFHLASWLNRAPPDGFATAPAITALSGVKITCIYGDKERQDICPGLPGTAVTKVRLPGGHHFNGDYASLGAEVLKASGQDSGAASP